MLLFNTTEEEMVTATVTGGGGDGIVSVVGGPKSMKRYIHCLEQNHFYFFFSFLPFPGARFIRAGRRLATPRSASPRIY